GLGNHEVGMHAVTFRTRLQVLLDSWRPVGIFSSPLSQAPIVDFMEIPVTRGSNDMARCIVGRVVGCDIYHIGKADQRGQSKYLLRSVGVVVQLPAGMQHDYMAITGIGGEERCHIDERRREGRHEVGRNWSSLQDRATIMNVEDAASLHSDNDVARVDIEAK